MAYTFNPPVDPDPQSKWSRKPRILKTEFGDTFAQRASDGMQNMPLTLNLQWTELTAAQKSLIIGFFQARRGYQSFDYIYPGETAKFFICEEYNWVHVAPDHYNITATLQQVYDIQIVVSSTLREDGTYLLREDGSRILLEG
jgi:phage-related protein